MRSKPFMQAGQPPIEEPVRRPGRRIVRISRSLFSQMLISGERHYVVKNGLPVDASLVKMSMDIHFMSDEVTCMFESLDWSEIDEGGQLPEVRPKFEMLQEDYKPFSERISNA